MGGKGNKVKPYKRLRIVHQLLDKQLHGSKQVDFALKYTQHQ